jgi:hypothetical protein
VLRKARERALVDVILLVLHSGATVDRLVDLLAALKGLDRIKIEVTLEAGRTKSQFDCAALRKRLDDLGIELVPWRVAVRTRYAVVLSTHATRGLLRRRWPNLVVMPHGAGYNRIRRRNTGSSRTPVGLSTRELTRRRFHLLVPKVICLSADEQRAQLPRRCRRLLDRVRVVDDPAYAMLRRNMVRRPTFRADFRAGREQRLIVIATTYTDESLYRKHKEVIARLLAALPADQYRIVLVQHPNIPAVDGQFGTDLALGAEQQAGLIILPAFDGGWRAAVIAADLVVGDHGSVTFYAGAIGRPVLALRTGVVELAEESPFRLYLEETVELDPDGDLRNQVETTIADYKDGQFDEVVPHVISRGEKGLEHLREIILELLGREPSTEPVRCDAVPRPVYKPPEQITSYQVRVVAERHRRGRLTMVRLERVSDAVGRAWQSSVEDVITAVEYDDVNIRDKERCEIVLRFDLDDRRAAEAWTTDAHVELPGVTVAAAVFGDQILLRASDGRLFQALPATRGKPVAAERAYMSAFLLWTLLLSENDLDSPSGNAVKVLMTPYDETIRIRRMD